MASTLLNAFVRASSHPHFFSRCLNTSRSINSPIRSTINGSLITIGARSARSEGIAVRSSISPTTANSRIQRGMEVAVAEQARTPEADGMSVNYYQPRFLEVGKRTKAELERIRRELGQTAEADVRWAMGPDMARMLK